MSRGCCQLCRVLWQGLIVNFLFVSTEEKESYPFLKPEVIFLVGHLRLGRCLVSLVLNSSKKSSSSNSISAQTISKFESLQ